MVLTREKMKVAGFTKLDEKVMQQIAMEKPILSEAVAVIRKAAPMMEEVELLVDAASRLSEPFLLVIVNLLSEYSTWLSSSTIREANLCVECFHERWDVLVAQDEKVPSDPNEIVNEGEKLSIKALDGFSASAAAKVFEELRSGFLQYRISLVDGNLH